MENNENSSGEINESKKSVKSVDSKVKKLKIKRFRRKDGEKKKKKDPLTPKHPLTGYIRYMNVRREELKKLHPESTAIELTKIIGEEWNGLSDDLKKPFLDAAELDKERYHKEYAVYEANKWNILNRRVLIKYDPISHSSTSMASLNFIFKGPKQSSERSSPEISERPLKTKTNGITPKLEKKPDKEKSDKKSDEKTPEKRPEKPLIREEPPTKVPRTGEHDIQIFTEEFLDHNKIVDTELKMLRKSNIDYEQQNSVLEKYVEHIRTGISKLENETSSLKSYNQVLQTYLSKLRKKLTTALAGLSLPGELEPCNLQNIDKYMNALHQMATNSHGPASLNKAKDIVRKLDLQIQL